MRTAQCRQGRYWQLPAPAAEAPPAVTARRAFRHRVREKFDEVRAHPHDRRCPAGRLPERRHRFQFRGRLHGAAIAGAGKTFSIGFEESGFNELPYAAMVAAQYRTDHHEIIVRPDAVDLVSNLVRHFDEPFGDSSAIPTFIVSEFAAPACEGGAHAAMAATSCSPATTSFLAGRQAAAAGSRAAAVAAR